jgi:hypothetical protein
VRVNGDRVLTCRVVLRLAVAALAGMTVACGAPGGGQRVEHDYRLDVTVQITGAVAVSGSYQGSPLVGASAHACADSVRQRSYLLPYPNVAGHRGTTDAIPVRQASEPGTFKVDGPLTIDGREFNLTDAGTVTLQPDGSGRLEFSGAPSVPPGAGTISGSIAWTCHDVTRTIG